MKRAFWAATALPFGVAAAFAVWSFVIEPDRLIVRQETIRLKPWPAAFDGLRVVLISDIHAGAPHIDLDKVRRVVALANEQNPDLIVLLGDYISNVIGGRFIEPEDVGPALEGLRASLGVYAILGNHDWWYDGVRVTRALHKAGIAVLEDDIVELRREGQSLWLAGLGDQKSRNTDPRWPVGRIPEGETVVVLTHNPDLYPVIPKRAILMLAGHTHGGQVNLPYFGRPVIPSRFGSWFAGGHRWTRDGRHIYVTSGIGTTYLPIRFRVPPEIVVLTLKTDS